MDSRHSTQIVRYDRHHRARALAAKTTECRDAHRRFNATSMRLAGVRAKIRNALRTGRLAPSNQLEAAQRAVDANLKAVARSLDRLHKAGDVEWEIQRTALETTWEDLYRSVKRLVAVMDDAPYV